jgi:type IV pilus assembly protein PilF
VFKTIAVFLFSLFLSACAVQNVNSTELNNLAEINVNLGLYELKQNHTLLAKDYLLQALKLDPLNVHAQAAWGYYLMDVGDEAGADAAYTKALNLAPDDSEVQNDYAVFLYKEGHYQEALQYFLKAAGNEHYLYSGLAYQNASLAAQKLGNSALANIYMQDAERAGFGAK